MFNKLILNNLLKDWKTFAAITGIFYGISTVFRKYLFVNDCDFYDVVIMFMLFYAFFLIISVFVVCYIKNRNIIPIDKNINKVKKILFITSISALFTVIGLWSKNRAFFLADNNVRVETIAQPIKLIFVFIISSLILSAKWSKNTFIGMIFGILAIYFVSKN